MDNTPDTIYQDYQFLSGSQQIRGGLIFGGKISVMQKKVDVILQKITSSNNFKEKYKFLVFQSSSTQVLHTKNKEIYIPSGLLVIAKNNDQIAFILSHEIAHWENQDIRNNQVPIHRSPGQVTEAECLADKKAIEISLLAQYSRKEIDALLLSLKNERPVCE